MGRAFSTFKIKAATDNGEERIITGIASTSTPDRDDDIIEPGGAKFAQHIKECENLYSTVVVISGEGVACSA